MGSSECPPKVFCEDRGNLGASRTGCEGRYFPELLASRTHALWRDPDLKTRSSEGGKAQILCGRVSRPMKILRQCLSTDQLSQSYCIERVLLVYDNIQSQLFPQMMSLGVRVRVAEALPLPWLRYNGRKSLARSVTQELFGCSLSTGELVRRADPRVHPRPAELVHVDLNSPS